MRPFQKQLGQVGLVMIPSPLQAFFRILRMGVQGLFFLVAAMGLAHAQTVPAHADYQRATYDPIHFKPAIDKATNAQCLACHAEVLEPSVRNESIAGVKASQAKAWYQQVSTYQGEQDTFHRRHMSTAYAKQVMNLQCTTCHQGKCPARRGTWYICIQPKSSLDAAQDGQRREDLPDVPWHHEL
jgi:hypothetical protein